MAKAASEMEYSARFDVILVNDHLADTLMKGRKIVQDFLQKPIILEQE